MHAFRSFASRVVPILSAARLIWLVTGIASAAPHSPFERGAVVALNGGPIVETVTTSSMNPEALRRASAAPVVKEDGTVVLSPFEVSLSFPQYITCGCGSSTSGVRLTTDMYNVIAQTTPEALLPFITDPFLNPGTGRPGAAAGLLEGLPVATVVDSATIDHIASQTTDSSWNDIMQRHAPRRPGTMLTVSGESADFASISMQTTARPGGSEGTSTFEIFSADKFGDPRWSAFVEGEKNVRDTRFRIGGQWRKLAGYGEMRLLRGAFEQRLSAGLLLEAVVAWHELHRDDPAQFRLGSATARYDGLGFLNLEQLTAETREISDAVAQVTVSGEIHTERRQNWRMRARWHRQESEWASVPGAAPANRRDTWAFDFSHHIAFADDAVHVTSHLGFSGLSLSRTTKDGQTAPRGGIEIEDGIDDRLMLFVRANREEAVPWISTGRWQTLGSTVLAVAPATEIRTDGEAGVKLKADRQFGGTLGVFHETIAGHEYRDWNWERTHAVAEITGNETRLPASTRVARDFVRQGGFGSITYNPSHALTTFVSCSVDFTNQGPTRGGNVRASGFANYEFRSGPLHGLTTGAALHYRNALVFDDGYTMSGGWRADLMFTYRFWSHMKRETLLQLNLINLSGRAWPLTRFAPDHGRQILLTATQMF